MTDYIEIENLTDVELLIFCDEIYKYQSENGDLDKNAIYYNFFKEHQKKYNWDIKFFETLIIDLATLRFDSIVKLLILNRPHAFIQK